jgi:hypothetical protein
MSATGEMFLRMEADYNELSEQQRSVFTYAEKLRLANTNYTDDPNYISL